MSDPRLLSALEGLIREHARPGHVPLIGIAGSQGSGKTTVGRAAAKAFGAAHLSLDDVYLTRAERQALAAQVHPLFAVRGPPGTHDLELLTQTVAALLAAGPGDVTTLPAFDKLADDRAVRNQWPVFTGQPSAILLDGWRLGALPEDDETLADPINRLEAEQDPNGAWRRAVNARLRQDQAQLTDAFDAVLLLKAPSFDVVLDWRCEQQAGLLGLPPQDLPAEERARITDFIAYYERITRRMLDGHVRADIIAHLDTDRRVLSITRA